MGIFIRKTLKMSFSIGKCLDFCTITFKQLIFNNKNSPDYQNSGLDYLLKFGLETNLIFLSLQNKLIIYG